MDPDLLPLKARPMLSNYTRILNWLKCTEALQIHNSSKGIEKREVILNPV